MECPVMLSNLSSYLGNNQAPSEEDIAQANVLREEPLIELANIDVIIREVQKTLDSLKARRDTIRCSIDRYDTILAPVRRLQEDVLREIFSYCLPTDRNPITNSSEAPLLLTHICRFWRSVACTTPQIWTSIYIPVFETVPEPIWAVSPSHLDHPEIFGLLEDRMQACCDLVGE
ncbi:hypothetical protein BDZ97DRAFT_1275246 [Flammula alnicola]|nr:hypothetical protein BDZ97DRAFT_1275246 [Flammula alnicola]